MKYMTAEPYRIKVVEHIGKTTKPERQVYLKEADYNVLKLKSDDIYQGIKTHRNVWSQLYMKKLECEQ